MAHLPSTWDVRGKPDTRADHIHEGRGDDYKDDDDNLLKRLWLDRYWLKRVDEYGFLDLDPGEYDRWPEWWFD